VAARGKRLLGVVDLASAYQQLRMKGSSSYALAIVTSKGVLRPLRMPYGPSNAPFVFQEVMERVLRQAIAEGRVVVYLDDLLIMGDSFDDYLMSLDMVLEALERAGFRANVPKSRFIATEVDYLGTVVNGTEVRVQTRHIQKILDCPMPMTVSAVRRFCGAVNWVASHVPAVMRMMSPFFQFMGKGARVPLPWPADMVRLHADVQQACADARPLTHVNANLPAYIFTDASLGGWAYAIFQSSAEVDPAPGEPLVPLEDGTAALRADLVPTRFNSGPFTAGERNQPTWLQEFAPLLYCIRQNREVLLAMRIFSFSDHQNLLRLEAMDSRQAALARATLESFSVASRYTPGICNAWADMRSRAYDGMPVAHLRLNPALGLLHPELAAGVGCMAPLLQTSDPAAPEPTPGLREWRVSGASVRRHVPLVAAEEDLRELPFGVIQAETLHYARPEGQLVLVFAQHRLPVDLRRDILRAQCDTPITARERWAESGFHSTVVEGPYTVHLLDGRLIVPSDAAPVLDAVMRLAHDDAGHPGETGTTNRILSSGVTIPSIHRVVREHVGSCVSCQIVKAGAKRDAYAPIGVVAGATHFMETVTVDLKGPLPLSRGCRYILVVVCRATRFTILESMIDATSRSFAEALGDVFMRFGIPDLVRSDSGPCMVGPEARMLEEQLGYVHDRSVNRPARNGDVERRMPMVATDLATAFMGKVDAEWGDGLLAVMNDINATFCASIGMSPYKAVYGREPTTTLSHAVGMKPQGLCPMRRF
jgi:hypothetical protein